MSVPALEQQSTGEAMENTAEKREYREALLIASLFHDIGKFEYRAERTDVPHAVNSGRFIRENLSGFKALGKIAEQAAAWAESHHSGSCPVALRKADRTSAAERTDDEERQARRPLRSVFACIDIGKGTPPPDEFFYKPVALSAKGMFPERGKDQDRLGPDELMKLHSEAWKGFLEELAVLRAEAPGMPFAQLVTTLYSLLERWTSRVVSAAYYSVPDITLFDHLRTVAALADCIHLAGDDQKPVLVVQGDLGGIQNFISRLREPDIAQKGMSKQLRGRSFYVRLLNEALARWVLDRLGLFRPNLLVSGGGHFLLLAPNTEETRGTLTALRQEANDWLLPKLHQDLSLVLEFEAFAAEELADFGNVNSRLAAKIARAKSHRAHDLLTSDILFGPEEDAGQRLAICPVCQSLVPAGEDGKLCAMCELHQRIGAAMPKTDYLVLAVWGPNGRSVPAPKAGAVAVTFEEFGQTWFLASSQRKTGPSSLDGVVTEVKMGMPAEFILLGNSQFLNEHGRRVLRNTAGAPVALGFAYVARELPKKNGEVLSFGEIAECGEAYPYLGVLRADVDDLGFVFQRGFGEQLSLSRYATLSRELDLFFSGYVDLLAAQHDIYVTYSGGDDLFVVGNWANVVEFALGLREKFAKLTCGNPNLGLSAGMSIHRPSYPIRLAGESAAEAEEKAKAVQGKDAFCGLGITVSWHRAEELTKYAKALVSCIRRYEHEKRVAVRSSVREAFEANARAYPGAGLVRPRELAMARPRLAYSFARNLGMDARDLLSQENEIAAVFGRIILDVDLFRDFSFPGAYALLATRRTESK